MTLNHLVRLEECILSSLDLPNGGKSLHRILLMDACAAWHRDALNLEYVIPYHDHDDDGDHENVDARTIVDSRDYNRDNDNNDDGDNHQSVVVLDAEL